LLTRAEHAAQCYDEQSRCCGDLDPDGQIHRQRVCGNGSQRVMAKAVEAEGSIDCNQQDASHRVATANEGEPERTHGGNRKPCCIDFGPRKPNRHVWILGKVLRIVDKVREAGRAIQGRERG
jgi:hypothetical protein